MAESRSRLSGIALLALLCPAVFASPTPREDETVVLASGPPGGVYHRLAEGIRERLEEDGIEVRIVPKPDCAESLDWLEEEPEDSKEVRFAFVQQDLVGERFRKNGGTPVRVVDRIAYDYLHIFVRKSMRVDSVSDLGGRRVWLGEKGTAVRSTAIRFLESIGTPAPNVLTYEDLERVPWTDDDLRVEGYAVEKLPTWLHGDQLDAAMLVAPAGAPEILEILRTGCCRLLSLTHAERHQIRSGPGKDPFLRNMALGVLPEDAYEERDEQISMAAVPVLLLAREGTDLERAKAVRIATREALASFQSFPEPKPLADPGLKWLEGIRNPDYRFPLPLKIWLAVLAVLGAIALCVVHRRHIRRGARRLRRTRRVGYAFNQWYRFRPVIFVTLGVLVCCMAVITGLSWHFEHEVNRNFSTLWEAWWSITLYIFSGLDQDRAPRTLPGHVLGAIGLIIGWLISIGVTGKAIAILIRKERKMPPRVKKHLVILNWNNRGMDIVRELHHPSLEKHGRTSSIVVLSDHPDPDLQQFSVFPDVYSRKGDPTNEADLRRVRVHEARTVVVLANENRGDDWAIRSVLKLRKIADEHPGLHVVVELIDPANMSIIEDLGNSFKGLLEAVSDTNLRTCVIAQAALIEGIAEFYLDLLSVRDDNNEVYTVALPTEVTSDWTFRDYSAFVLQNYDPANPIIPVGVQRQIGQRQKVFTNPKANGGEFYLEPGDRLVVISYGPPEEDCLPVPPKRALTVTTSPSGEVPLPPQPVPQAP